MFQILTSQNQVFNSQVISVKANLENKKTKKKCYTQVVYNICARLK